MTTEGAQARLACRRCGCHHLPILYTRQTATAKVRVRRCRNCGARYRTRETLGSPIEGEGGGGPAAGERMGPPMPEGGE